jgi:putative hemolysin
MWTEFLIVLVLVLGNGLFAGAEIAILNIRRSRVLEGASRRDRRALAVQALRSQPERFLATVQIGITVISTAASAFGGASIARTLTPILERLGLTQSAAADMAIVLVVVLISFLSLVLGELVPKSLALKFSDGYAFLVARPLLRLSRLAAPLVWVFTASSNLVLRMFGDRTNFTETRMSRDELTQLVQEAAKVGSVDERSSEIASNALTFGEITAAEVMVPREQIIGIAKDAGAEEIQRVLLEEGHSRMPIYDEDMDHVVGYVVARDVLALVWERQLVLLDDIIRPITAFPASARINVVLHDMQARRVQIAIIVDEHGGTAGLVTMEDLVEELVGDIADEDEAPTETIRRESADTVLVPGWMPVRKVNRTLGTALPISRDSTTIAGLCMALALAIPVVGTRLQAPDGSTLEVADASPRRVRMVRLHYRRPEAETAPLA